MICTTIDGFHGICCVTSTCVYLSCDRNVNIIRDPHIVGQYTINKCLFLFYINKNIIFPISNYLHFQ